VNRERFRSEPMPHEAEWQVVDMTRPRGERVVWWGNQCAADVARCLNDLSRTPDELARALKALDAIDNETWARSSTRGRDGSGQ
jgi:hypothetical protein